MAAATAQTSTATRAQCENNKLLMPSHLSHSVKKEVDKKSMKSQKKSEINQNKVNSSLAKPMGLREKNAKKKPSKERVGEAWMGVWEMGKGCIWCIGKGWGVWGRGAWGRGGVHGEGVGCMGKGCMGRGYGRWGRGAWRWG
ncbi:hypothetical protein V8E53_002620 [Lactarius tabidus]